MTLVDPTDSLERQNAKLLQIAHVLMRRVEATSNETGFAYAQFERAALLEGQVRERTQDLERALELLHETNGRLAEANARAETAHGNLADAIETVSDGFALFDAEDRLVLTNSRFCQDFEDMADALRPGLGYHAYIHLVSQSRSLSLPEGKTPAAWAAARARRHGEAHGSFHVRLALDRWLQISEHRTARGGTVVLQTDVTDIMREERSARDRLIDRQAKLVRATLDHLNQGVWIFDGRQMLAGWNRKAFELLRLDVPSRIATPRFEQLLARIQDAHRFRNGFSAGAVLNWAKGAGRRHPLAFELQGPKACILSVFAREMPDGGFVISVTDVTAERQAAEALFQMNELLERRVEERTLDLEDALARAEAANASKSQFVAAASHDLMQPLSAAKLFVSSLAEQTQDTELAPIAAKAEAALLGAQHIIETLLDMSRLESGAVQFDRQDVALRGLLAQLHDEFADPARQKGLRLRMVGSDLCVHSDPVYLRRILQNLIGNAVRYTDRGRVLVGVRRNGGSARIEVWDTGPGIPEDHQRLIFEAFKQAPGAARAGQGVGLGLAIVERAAQALDHPLSLWSRPGQGSCFSLNVPIAKSARAAVCPRIDAPARQPVLRGMLVLLVENDRHLARALEMMIEAWGGYVITAETGEEALDLLAEIEVVPDVVLADYQLGVGMTGLALVQDLARRFGPLPARIVSANRTRELREDCAAVGASVITKPIDRSVLAQFLEQVCRGEGRP